MNLKFNRKNYKSNLVEFSEEMKYIKIYFLIIIFYFYITLKTNFLTNKNVSFYYSEKY